MSDVFDIRMRSWTSHVLFRRRRFSNSRIILSLLSRKESSIWSPAPLPETRSKMALSQIFMSQMTFMLPDYKVKKREEQEAIVRYILESDVIYTLRKPAKIGNNLFIKWIANGSLED